MSEVYLTDAICRLLEEALAAGDVVVHRPPVARDHLPGALVREVTQQTHEDELVHIPVYNGILPPRENEKPVFPYVLVTPARAEINNGGATATVVISVGTYGVNDEAEAYKDCLNICRRIINTLGTLPGNKLERRYEKDTAMEWSMAADETPPYFGGQIVTRWSYQSVRFPF